MRNAAQPAGQPDLQVRPARSIVRAFTRALLALSAFALLEFAPGWARNSGWAPQADFAPRFALLPARGDAGCPADVLRGAVAIAMLLTVWKLRRKAATQAAVQLAAGLLLLRAALAWWLPWRSGAAHLESAHWLEAPAALGAPAPLSWFAWIGLIAVWAPQERGGSWGSVVALLAGALAWWACGLADLGGGLIVATLAAPLWLGYRSPAE